MYVQNEIKKLKSRRSYSGAVSDDSFNMATVDWFASVHGIFPISNELTFEFSHFCSSLHGVWFLGIVLSSKYISPIGITSSPKTVMTMPVIPSALLPMNA